MTWGLPPTYTYERKFNQHHALILDKVKKSLINSGFTITNESDFIIEATKKMRLSVVSFLLFERAKIHALIRVEKSGKLVLKAVYDFDSRTGSAFYDFNRLKKAFRTIQFDIDNKRTY